MTPPFCVAPDTAAKSLSEEQRNPHLLPATCGPLNGRLCSAHCGRCECDEKRAILRLGTKLGVRLGTKLGVRLGCSWVCDWVRSWVCDWVRSWVCDWVRSWVWNKGKDKGGPWNMDTNFEEQLLRCMNQVGLWRGVCSRSPGSAEESAGEPESEGETTCWQSANFPTLKTFCVNRGVVLTRWLIISGARSPGSAPGSVGGAPECTGARGPWGGGVRPCLPAAPWRRRDGCRPRGATSLHKSMGSASLWCFNDSAVGWCC